MKKKVLFIDSVHPLIRERFEAEAFVCDYFQDYGREDYADIIHEYSGIIIRSKIKLDRDILIKAKNLSFIGRLGAGMENIDVQYAESNGIKCFHSPEGSRDAVGEHALGLLLALLRRINIADSEVRNGEWIREGNRGTEIKGKTVGIIGYGNMGSAFAEKLSGLGARVIAYDKYKQDFSGQFVREVSMDEIYRETDILSLHVPLTEETMHLFNSKYLSNFSREIFLVNTARGMNVNTADLVEGIISGKVKGAALDVLEYEDLSFEQLDQKKLPEAYQYLVKSDRTVLTSHIAGWTHESKVKLAEVLVDKILSYLQT